MNPLDSFSFTRLLWLVPVFFALHNMEEAPFMADWSKKLPVKIRLVVSTRQFVIAVTILTLAGFILTFLGTTQIPQPIGYLVILEIQMALAFNAILPHLLSTLRFRMYSPGVISAILINLPFSYYLFQRALNEGHIVWTKFWVLLALAPFVTVIAAWASLQVGKWLAGLRFTASDNTPGNFQ